MTWLLVVMYSSLSGYLQWQPADLDFIVFPNNLINLYII